ncbi:hypothetical protein [Chitinophaga sp. YIM B06452]|uniref:hypothetical protein n=1 Tax=Chitinophaga sp. YIM B06452 TaxID=3082158 RepID=UPI0031FF2E7F
MTPYSEPPEMPGSFNFQWLECLTIDSIKQRLGITALQFRTIKAADGSILDYCCHWDFERKLTVRMERALIHQVKADASVLLNLKRQWSAGKYGAYHLFTVTAYVDNWPDYTEGEDSGHEQQYSVYNGYNDWTDDDIDIAFEGDPDNTWNTD